MSNSNKLPASAGAEWLLGGFALLRAAPAGLGQLGVIWGLASVLLSIVASLAPVLLLPMQLLIVLAGPLLFAGIVWAVREVAAGRPAQPAHLLQGVREGHAGRLLATLLPQAAAGIAFGVLLLVMVGFDQLRALGEVWTQMEAIAQAGGQPDPSLFDGLPAGLLLLWLLLVALGFVAVKWMTFIAAPLILFSGADAWTAMRTSLRACLRNWTAMLVFYLLAGIAVFAFMIGLLVVVGIAQLLVGATLAVLLWQGLLMAVLMPVFAGSIYTAWRQMLGDGGADAAPQAQARIEV
ncbi:BPSS1780 family membrane protein [Pseudoxanthomonas mexicana]|uniref:BPSS1780 family membrane protein n=1 Tax=Pseudoxanthomonas mexicana TaxID=128785 RepID=UPI00398B8A7E